MRAIGWLGGVLIVVFLAGCAATIDVPKGYVKVRYPRPYDLKAVSARGNVIGLRVRANENASADLKFWSQAVEHQKVDLDGMKLAGRDSIRSRSGLDGVLFNFEAGEGQGKATYLLALYVTPQRIYTIEAGGPASELGDELSDLRQAIESLH